jgi:hypothetical protein
LWPQLLSGLLHRPQQLGLNLPDRIGKLQVVRTGGLSTSRCAIKIASATP